MKDFLGIYSIFLQPIHYGFSRVVKYNYQKSDTQDQCAKTLIQVHFTHCVCILLTEFFHRTVVINEFFHRTLNRDYRLSPCSPRQSQNCPMPQDRFWLSAPKYAPFLRLLPRGEHCGCGQPSPNCGGQCKK